MKKLDSLRAVDKESDLKNYFNCFNKINMHEKSNNVYFKKN